MVLSGFSFLLYCLLGIFIPPHDSLSPGGSFNEVLPSTCSLTVSIILLFTFHQSFASFSNLISLKTSSLNLDHNSIFSSFSSLHHLIFGFPLCFPLFSLLIFKSITKIFMLCANIFSIYHFAINCFPKMFSPIQYEINLAFSSSTAICNIFLLCEESIY